LRWISVSARTRSLVTRGFGHRFHHAVEIEAAGLLARRELAEALQPLADIGTGPKLPGEFRRNSLL
jgi:hypothetical protein